MNFLEGVMQATGDVIFYCDQDDIWEKEKVRLISECFQNNENVMVCGHDVTLFNEDGGDAFSVLNKAGGGTLEQFDFLKMLKTKNGDGHTLAMRKSFRDVYVPIIIKTDGMIFDGGVVAAAAVYGQFYVLHTSLVRHRIHKHNNSTKSWTFHSRIRDIDRQIASREAKVRRVKSYVSCFSDKISKKDKKTVNKFLKFTEKRIGYLKERKLLRCVFQTFHYNRINDWKFLMTDIFCILSNK